MKVKEVLDLVFGPVKLFYEGETWGKYGKETDYFESEYRTTTEIRKYYGNCKIECISVYHGDDIYDDAVEIYVNENHEEE